jgi:hypothetical protein
MFSFATSPVKALLKSSSSVEVTPVEEGLSFTLRKGFAFDKFIVPNIKSGLLLKEMVSEIWNQGLHKDALEFLKVASTPYCDGTFAMGLEHLENTLKAEESIKAAETIAQRLRPWVLALPPQKRGGAEVFFDAYDFARRQHSSVSDGILPERAQFDRVELRGLAEATTPLEATDAAVEEAPQVQAADVSNSVHDVIVSAKVARLPVELFPVLGKQQLAVQHTPSPGGSDESMLILKTRLALKMLGIAENQEVTNHFRSISYEHMFNLSAAYAQVNGLSVEENFTGLFLAYFVESEPFNKLAVTPAQSAATAAVMNVVSKFSKGCISAQMPVATVDESTEGNEAPVTTITTHKEAAANIGRKGRGRKL